MDTKSKKKSQSQNAMEALFEAAKAFIAVIAAAVAYLGQWGPVVVTICTFIVLYYAFVLIEKNIIMTLLRYYRRAIKFNKLHSFIEEVETKSTEIPIRQFFDNNLPSEKRKKHRRREKNRQALDLQEDDRLDYSSYVPSKIEGEEMTRRSHRDRIQTQMERKEYEKKYLIIREEYKKSFAQIFKKEDLREQFEATLDKIRSYYLRKVSELLLMNDANLIQMKEQLEKYYQVQIMDGEDEEVVLNVVKVSIDDAIMRLMEYKEKKCFPWTEKTVMDQRTIREHVLKLERITEDRRQIDSFLAPYYPLDQKLREQVIEALEDQMQESGRLNWQLAYTVAEIWNDHLKNNRTSEKYFIYKKDFTTRQCLQLQESKICNRFHLDLVVKRSDKEQKIVCNPGSNNLWTLIAFAVEIIKQKK